MGRAPWSLPVLFGVLGTAWIVFLGWDIWATPDAGRPTEPELVSALGAVVTQRDTGELQSLFTADNLPADYAKDYLAQVPEGGRAVARAGSDALGPLVTLQVTSIGGDRCTTWRVDENNGRFALAAGPVLSAPCDPR